MHSQTPDSTGPLNGVVVDLTRALAGPHAAMMLGDLGAEVIKVENPGGGDDTRGWGPPFVEPGGRRAGVDLLPVREPQQAVDHARPEGRRTAGHPRGAGRRADVLMENFRTGVLDRLGFSPQRLAELNPRLVVLSISGFGHDGPEGGRAGYDQIAQGEAGLMSLTGSGPDDIQRVGVPIADLLAGMYGAFGVLAALRERERTGRGQVVRTSLLAGVVGVHAFQGTRWTVAGQVGEAQGNHHPSICPLRAVPHRRRGGADRGRQRRALAAVLRGFHLDPDTPGMATNPDRVENRKQVNEMVEEAFAACGTDELLSELDRIGVPAGRIRSIDEVYEWEQTQSQGLLVDVEHDTLGTITLPGPPLRFFTPDGTETTRTHHTAPPVLGARHRHRHRLAAGRQPMTRTSAHDVIATLADPGTWQSWDPPLDPGHADGEYAAELRRARARTGLDEAVLTGAATIRGRRVALLVGEFGFLGGSIGIAAGNRLVTAIRRATREQLPLLALPTSGGTRMQEGTIAFLQMVKITHAVVAHKAAHLPYLVYLRNPTTGGVFASWGSLGHVTLAEPGALVGFLGPRVYEALYGTAFPTGVQTAGKPARPRAARRRHPRRAARRHGAPRPRHHRPDPHAPPAPGRAAEIRPTSLRCRSPPGSRSPPRAAPTAPGCAELLAPRRHRRVALNGTGQGENEPGLLLALARFGDQPCVLLGQDRHSQTPAPPSAPAHCARHAAACAWPPNSTCPWSPSSTPPAPPCPKRPRKAASAGEIARCLADLVALRSRPCRCCSAREPAAAHWPCSRRPHPRRPARLAVPASARGRQRDPAPRHRPRPRHGRQAGRARHRPARTRHRRPHHRRIPRRRSRTRAILPPCRRRTSPRTPRPGPRRHPAATRRRRTGSNASGNPTLPWHQPDDGERRCAG